MATVMALLPADNDENVTVVLPMLMELHKAFRQRKSDSAAAAAAAGADDGQPPMEQHVGPYLEFVKKVWRRRSCRRYTQDSCTQGQASNRGWQCNVDRA